MNIAVALLTCDRYDYTVRTIAALKRHNDTSGWPLFYADDASQDPRVRPFVESEGFRPLLLNDGERMGCSPISDGLLQAVRREVGPDWLVLYLQNDFVATRPIPLDLAGEWFDEPTHAALRLHHFPGRLRRKQRKHRFPIRTYAGERVLKMNTAAWPVQLSRLDWYADIVRGARREHTLHIRARQQQPRPITGIVLDAPFRHIGKTKTPQGIYRSPASYDSVAEVVVSMTTIPNRVEQAHDAISNILTGSVRPDRFLLNVAFDPPDFLTDLPIEIQQVDDVGPATKLLPVLDRYRDRDDVLIVTADDDVLYADDWLASLVDAARSTPHCVVCAGGRRITSGGYRKWPKSRKATRPAFDLLPMGVFGVAYRPSHFTDRVFDVDTMRQLTPHNDEFWFAATLRRDVPIRIVACGKSRAIKTHGPRLALRNLRGRNDRAIARLNEATGWPHGRQ